MVLEEQRNWIAMKEEVTLMSLGSQEENGSMYPMLVNSLWEEKNGMIYIYDQRKNLFGKEKTRAVELNKSEIYSLSNGRQEQIMYYQDTMLGDYYSPEEMRMYLAGAGDARKNYKARHISAIGFVLCGLAGYFVGDGLLILIVPPITYAAIQYVGKIKIREKYMSDTNFKFNDLYAEGFEPPARSRKMIRGALSGVLGSATGVVLYFIKNQ
ncbi:MAG: hypothetical protein ACEQSL_10685, partial [Sediminibacterium sp.]